MRYNIQQSILKNTQFGDVRDITCTDVSGASLSGSVSRKQKDGTDFPNFDGLVVGTYFEANAWTNPTSGKVSFFPPKSPTGAPRRSSGVNIAKAQETKRVDIQNAQDNKAESIRMAATLRDAVLIATTMAEYEKYDSADMASKITYWREWLNNNWEINET